MNGTHLEQDHLEKAYLEHTNFTVKNPDELASLFCHLFDWKIRWEGGSLDDGRSVHVGSESSYLALYTHEKLTESHSRNHLVNNNLNHLGLVVFDLDIILNKIKKEGYTTFNYGDYDPGRRFYFMVDELEIEIISYI